MLPRLTEDVTLSAYKAWYCTLKIKMLKINLFYLFEFVSQLFIRVLYYVICYLSTTFLYLVDFYLVFLIPLIILLF